MVQAWGIPPSEILKLMQEASTSPPAATPLRLQAPADQGGTAPGVLKPPPWTSQQAVLRPRRRRRRPRRAPERTARRTRIRRLRTLPVPPARTFPRSPRSPTAGKTREALKEVAVHQPRTAEPRRRRAQRRYLRWARKTRIRNCKRLPGKLSSFSR